MANKNGDDRGIKQDIIEMAILFFYYFIMSAIGFFALFGWGGFTEALSQSQYFVYSFPILFFIVYLAVVKIAHRFGYFKNVVAFVHDPEYGLLGWLPFIKNPVSLFIIGVLFFSILGFTGAFVGAFAQQSIIADGINTYLFGLAPGEVAQQTTPAGKLFFSLYAAPGENAWGNILFYLFFLTPGFLLMSRIKAFRMLTTRQKIGILFLPVVLLFGLSWMVIHSIVSGSSEFLQLSHFLFGVNAAMFILLTGSLILYEIYHLTNNLFNALNVLFGNELMIVIFFIIMILMIIMAFFYFRSESYRNQNQQNNDEK